MDLRMTFHGETLVWSAVKEENVGNTDVAPNTSDWYAGLIIHEEGPFDPSEIPKRTWQDL